METNSVLLVYLQNSGEIRIGGVFTDIPRALEGAKNLVRSVSIRRQIDTARIEPGKKWMAATIEGWIIIEPLEVDHAVEFFR